MWKGKIEKEINEIRGEVAIFDELLRGVKVKSRKPDKMKKKYAMKKWEETIRGNPKTENSTKSSKIRRYEKRTKFYRQNGTFKSDKKKFYRELGSK